MNVTFKLTFERSQVNKEIGSIKICFYESGKNREYLKTGIAKIPYTDFDMKSQCLTSKKRDYAKENQKLQRFILECNQMATKWAFDGVEMSAKSFKDWANDYFFPPQGEQKKEQTLDNVCLKEVIEQRISDFQQKIRIKNGIKTGSFGTIRKLKSFHTIIGRYLSTKHKTTETLMIGEINARLVKDFSLYLRSNSKTETNNGSCETLRTFKAILNGVNENYPFKIEMGYWKKDPIISDACKQPIYKSRATTKDVIEIIANYKGLRKKEEMYRDMFLLGTEVLGGIALCDLINLRTSEINSDGTFTFERMKCHKQPETCFTPSGMDLIKKWKNDTENIFPFFTKPFYTPEAHWNRMCYATTAVNKVLAKICKACKIPKITYYSARGYVYSTLLGNGIPLADVCQFAGNSPRCLEHYNKAKNRISNALLAIQK